MTAAFVAAHPELIWLHAAAASRNGAAILLAGPAGAGKSTLLVQLVERGWELVADDVAALRPNRGEALPLPFSPEVRAIPPDPGEDWLVFLTQPKALTTVASDRVASQPAVVAAIVFPQYVSDLTRPLLMQLTAVSGAQALATQVLGARPGSAKMSEMFDLARRIPCYRLRYSGPVAAVGELATLA
jgi:UDP-N-acetylglucosamine enolpyruvyl transferase